MERPSVIVGIHGLANKPPVDEKTRWWKAAIAEGLARNEELVDAVQRMSPDHACPASMSYEGAGASARSPLMRSRRARERSSTE